ncbi:MAG: FISUMP domain-containing protein, partial [Bacteroidota bacterium]
QWANLTSGQMNIGNGQTYTTSNPAVYRVTVVGPNSCLGRDTVILSTNPLIPVNVSVSAVPNPACTNSTVTFYANGTNEGANPSFQWKVNGGNVGGNSLSYAYMPMNGDLVNVVMTSSETCTSGNPATSNPVVMIVNPVLTVGITISASANPVCAGTSVTFNALPTNGGTNPFFQWRVNGANQGTNAPNFSYIPINGDIITCTLTSSEVCTVVNPVTSTNIVMTVHPALPVAISITSSEDTVCAGMMVSYNALSNNQGVAPYYQWKVNGVNQGNNSPGFSYNPSNGDVITCTMTSSEQCTVANPVTSNSITMVVKPLLLVSLFITTSSGTVCAGTAVTFTANPTHGGAFPYYQWKVNGINVGTNQVSYSYVPMNSDVITCTLTSSETCAIGNPALSNAILMVVNNLLPVSITISASKNPICPGATVTFTATSINGGTLPAYQWKWNGTNAGAGLSYFSCNPSIDDSIQCIVNSSLGCVTQNPASSNTVTMQSSPVPVVSFIPCFDTITSTVAKPVKLKGGIPLGGIYSGPGVSSGYYYPSVAGAGAHIITYTYTNAALCTALAHTTLFTLSSSLFTCGTNLIDPRDNKTYPTVKIATQCWMASNLNYGTPVSSIQHQRDNCVNEKYCYQDLSANCAVRGANYQWDEIMRYDDTPGLQGLCPPGWHVPTQT